MDPPLLLMDEPTASLDPARRGSLGEALEDARRAEGRALLVATHDDDFARDFATASSSWRKASSRRRARPRILINPSHPATQALLQHRNPHSVP